MKKLFLFILSLLIMTEIGCQKEPETLVLDTILKIKNKYAKDTRTAIFNVTATSGLNKIVIKGEVESNKVKSELLDSLNSLSIPFTDSIIALEENFGKNNYGIVHLSVANMRSLPKQSAELGSQTLLGTIIKIWKRDGEWSYIQTPDKYLCWMENESFTKVKIKEAKLWSNSEKIIVTTLFDLVYSSNSDLSEPISDVVAGNVLRILEKNNNFSKVLFPDGRIGFLKNSSFTSEKNWKSKSPSPESILKNAKLMMGVPYLWGGTSVKGVDCSGFTKTIYLLDGIQLNRDANQQAEQGEDILFDKDFSKFQKGDLLFFGRKETKSKPERITHVGIYMGNKKMIHSSGFVHINSFDKDSPLYSQSLLNRFVRAKRILTNTPPTVTNIFN
ncbi:MAG: C40 family peptidase [Bacteroidetes bacterium]|nr:C40 family peptidase [Bacteroidota bacterium]